MSLHFFNTVLLCAPSSRYEIPHLPEIPPPLLSGVHSWISPSLRRLQKEPLCLTWSELRGSKKKKKEQTGETLWSNFQLLLVASVLFYACLNGFPGDDVAGVCKWITVRICVCVYVIMGSFVFMYCSTQTNQSGTLWWLFLKVVWGDKHNSEIYYPLNAPQHYRPLRGHPRVNLTLTQACFKSWKLWAQEI